MIDVHTKERGYFNSIMGDKKLYDHENYYSDFSKVAKETNLPPQSFNERKESSISGFHIEQSKYSGATFSGYSTYNNNKTTVVVSQMSESNFNVPQPLHETP